MSFAAVEARPLTWIAAARLVQTVEDAFGAADLERACGRPQHR